MSGERLVLVYNADAGIVAAMLDSVHKLVSPATYPCSLCAVTYGPLAMRARWRDYLLALQLPVEFRHRPDFRAAYPAAADIDLPLIGLARGGDIEVLLSARDLDDLRDLDALVAALDRRLRNLALPGGRADLAQ